MPRHFTLPLDYSKPNGDIIYIYAREIVTVDNTNKRKLLSILK